MKKYLLIIVAAFALVATPAHADSWIELAESVKQVKLVAKIESIEISKYDKDDNSTGMRVSAIMKYVGKDPIPPFISIIDVEECVLNSGGVIVVVFPDSSTQAYSWSDGNTMIDAQGQFLCGYVKEKYRQRKAVPDGKKIQI